MEFERFFSWLICALYFLCDVRDGAAWYCCQVIHVMLMAPAGIDGTEEAEVVCGFCFILYTVDKSHSACTHTVHFLLGNISFATFYLELCCLKTVPSNMVVILVVTLLAR